MKDSAEDTLLRAESLGLHENSSSEREAARDVVSKRSTDDNDRVQLLQMLGLADDPHRVKRSPTHPSRPASRTQGGDQ